MEPYQWAILFKPFAALVIFGGIALPIRWAINKLLPDSWLKRELLKHRGGGRGL